MNNTALPKQVESQLQVRFPDCDPFNHLNNSRYIDYIINAREDQLVRFYGFDVYKMASETGHTWVVAQTQIAYLTSARLMEMLTIQTSLASFSEKSLLVEGLMWNHDKTQLRAFMWTKLVHYSLLSKKAHAHSPELMLFFRSIVNPLTPGTSFEERLKPFRTPVQ